MCSVDLKLFLQVSCRKCCDCKCCQGRCYNPFGPWIEWQLCLHSCTFKVDIRLWQGCTLSPLLLSYSQCAIVYSSLGQRGLHFKSSEKFLFSTSKQLMDIRAFGTCTLCQVYNTHRQEFTTLGSYHGGKYFIFHCNSCEAEQYKYSKHTTKSSTRNVRLHAYNCPPQCFGRWCHAAAKVDPCMPYIANTFKLLIY